MKTKEEVRRLKINWLSDPCFDLSLQPGFEDYRNELAEFENFHINKWADERREKINSFGQIIGIDNNFLLAEMIYGMRRAIFEMQEEIDKLKNK